VPAERIFITAGAQHAIAVTLAAATRPGDRILSESPCYPGIQSVARMLGLKLEGLPLDEEGLVPEAFEAACRGDGVKALYCLPTLQNPTNVTMPMARRRDIAGIAARHGVAILEDDVYGLLSERAPPPLASFAPETAYYLTSLSKTVAPGLRVGYIAAPAGAGDGLAAAIRASSWMASPITADLAARMIDGGVADQLMGSRRRETEARRHLALDILSPWLSPSQAAAPAGAIHLWLHLPEPWRSSEFAAAARRRGVNVTPAEAFIIGRQGVSHAVRLCLGPPRARETLEQGLRRLADLLDAGPTEALGAVV
jgi:DNA-binding transcriptional MocR family regulator